MALLPLLVAAAALSNGSKAPAETREEIAVLPSWHLSCCNEWALWEVQLLEDVLTVSEITFQRYPS